MVAVVVPVIAIVCGRIEEQYRGRAGARSNAITGRYAMVTTINLTIAVARRQND
jgi:hypothetical protein